MKVHFVSRDKTTPEKMMNIFVETHIAFKNGFIKKRDLLDMLD